MALSQTLTLSHGREFGGSNPGIRLDDSADPVEMDSGFFTVPNADSEVTGAFVKATFRARTAWLHLNTDLWLANIGGSPAGSRNDLGVDLYSPTTDKWCRLAFSTYATKSSRSDNLAQVSFNLTTPVPTGIAGRSYQSLNDWATAVEAALPHDVDVTFTSASSQQWRAPAPPAPDSVDGTFLGSKSVTGMFLGSKTVAAAFLGTKQVFGAPMTPAGMKPGTPTGLTLDAGNAQIVASWTAVSATPAATYRLRYRTGSGAWTEVPTSAVMATVSSLTNGTAYEFQVRAENSVGNSDWSASVTGTPNSLPTTWISLHSDNADPRGLWSDGTTIWVVDNTDDKLYAYTLTTGARDTTKEFDLASANDDPLGIWSDGTTVWVVDFRDFKLYAYTLATGARDSAKEFTISGNPQGVWSDGTTIWVADSGSDQMNAYTLATGAFVMSKSLALTRINPFTNLPEGSTSPGGTWSDGTTIWVADDPSRAGDKLYAYTLATKASDSSKDIDLNALNANPWGIWSDGTVMWVVDSTDDRIYPYRLSDGKALFPTS